jgi:hypothetical protein
MGTVDVVSGGPLWLLTLEVEEKKKKNDAITCPFSLRKEQVI